MRLLRALLGWVILRAFGWLAKPRRRPAREQRIVAPTEPQPRAEGRVALLLALAAASAAAFVVLYALEAANELLGLALGTACALVATALIVLAKRVLPTEELEENYPEPNPEEAGAVAQIARETGDTLTRKRLLVAAGGAAGCALGAAALVPALSLGPLLDTDPLHESPWRRGLRLVDEHNTPLTADDIEEGAFYTAFPERAPKDQIAAPVVLVRLPPATLQLPPERASWAPEGILAYSKICTHAGCAIALYRYPLSAPTAPRPALVCPCHYSTFDPARAAEVIFGPAGRPLPQLPLMLSGKRELLAGGDFSGAVGPGWSGVRERRRT